MNFLCRLFGKSESSEILCPHCEKAMEPEHDVDACARKRMSRRRFFGIMGGAAVAIALPKIPTGGLFNPSGNVAAQYASGNMVGNEFLTIDMITREMLAVLHNQLEICRLVSGEYGFTPHRKIGDILTVRRPSRFVPEQNRLDTFDFSHLKFDHKVVIQS